MTDLEQCCCTQSLQDQLNACMAQQTMNLQTQMLINSIRPFTPPAYSGVNPIASPFHNFGLSVDAIVNGFNAMMNAPIEHEETEEEQKQHHEQLDEIKTKVKEARECVGDYYKFRSKIYEIRDITSGRYEDARTKELDRQERVLRKFLHSLHVSGAILTALLALFLLAFFIVSVRDTHIIRAWLSFPWFFVSGASSLWLFAKSSEDEL